MTTASQPSAAIKNHNQLQPEDRAVHDWYRFVLSFPPHLVREYLEKLGADRRSVVLDPFCGTGTTLVECKKVGHASVGLEANPMAHFASRIKLDWTPSPGGLLDHAQKIAEETLERLTDEGISDEEFFSWPTEISDHIHSLAPEQMKLLLKNSISPLPLHKTLVLLDVLERRHRDEFSGHEKLALARALVDSIGNLHFGPEVGVRKIKADSPVVSAWLRQVRAMAQDLETLQGAGCVPAEIHLVDSRDLTRTLKKKMIDIVITSPPYPNEKDYTRTTRLESVILGFIKDKQQLRAMKETLIRSNTRNVFAADRADEWVDQNARISGVAQAIEQRRLELGKNSGFERLYSRVAKLYFAGMRRHLHELRQVLKPGARLAYVVGDQASYLRVMIRTGQLLGEVAESLGYEVVGLDLFRTRLATATREQLREEVLLLKWPEKKK